MSDEFLEQLARHFAAFEQRARGGFGGLSEEEFNRARSDGGWSIGQCLQHLVTSNEAYFPIFERVAAGTCESTIWQRLPWLPGLLGDAVLRTVHPENAKKSKAPRIFRPRAGQVPRAVLDAFCAQQRRLIVVVRSLHGADLDRIITSPVAVFITYSVRHALQILDAHEERHLRQAEGVLAELGVWR